MEAPTSTYCSFCNEIMADDQKFCTACGYPERGTQKEQSKFHADRILEMRDSSTAKDRVRKARNILYIMSGLSVFWGIVTFLINDGDIGSLVVYGILAVIYLVLAFWSQQKPLVAMILALLVYLTLIVLNAIFDASSIYRGIIFKIIIIIFLVNGLNSALHLRKE